MPAATTRTTQDGVIVDAKKLATADRRYRADLARAIARHRRAEAEAETINQALAAKQTVSA